MKPIQTPFLNTQALTRNINEIQKKGDRTNLEIQNNL